MAQQRDNIKIDIVLIDYLNILETLTTMNKRGIQTYEVQRVLAEEARAMGALNKAAVVTPVQANRQGAERNHRVGTEIIALGDFIGATADYVIRTVKEENEETSNTLSVSFLKNRHGARGDFLLRADLNRMYIGNLDPDGLPVPALTDAIENVAGFLEGYAEQSSDESGSGANEVD